MNGNVARLARELEAAEAETLVRGVRYFLDSRDVRDQQRDNDRRDVAAGLLDLLEYWRRWDEGNAFYWKHGKRGRLRRAYRRMYEQWKRRWMTSA